jgi:hypothetical protein
MSIHLPVKQDFDSQGSAPEGMAALPRVMKPKHNCWPGINKNGLAHIVS